MASSALQNRPALLIGAGVLAAALVIGLAIWLSGSGDDDPSTAADQSGRDVEQDQPELDYELDPGPRLDPEPEPVPVSGEVAVTDHVDVSIHDRDVYAAGQPEAEPIPTDEDAVAAFTDEVAAWLDQHLDDLQNGGTGSVPEDGLDGDSAILELAGNDADGEAFVRRATYTFTVYVRGEPEWLHAIVEVERRDGSTRSAELAFVQGDESVTLVAAEPTGETDGGEDSGADDENNGSDGAEGEA